MILLYDLAKDDRFSSVVEKTDNTISISYKYKNIPTYLRNFYNKEEAYSAEITVIFDVEYPEVTTIEDNKIKPGDIVDIDNLICYVGIPKRDLLWIGQKVLSVGYPAYVNKVNRNLIYFDKGTSYIVYRIFKSRRKFLPEKEVSKEDVNKEALIPFDINKIKGDSVIRVSYEERDYEALKMSNKIKLNSPKIKRRPRVFTKLYNKDGNLVYQNNINIDRIGNGDYLQIIYVPDTIYRQYHENDDIIVAGSNHVIFVINGDSPNRVTVMKISPLFLAKIFLNEDNDIYRKYDIGDTYHILGVSSTIKYGMGSLLLIGDVCFGDVYDDYCKSIKNGDVKNLIQILTGWAYFVNRIGSVGDLKPFAFADFIRCVMREARSENE
jgi:hypothetical protein